MENKKLFERAMKRDLTILFDNDVSKIVDENLNTPLHILAQLGVHEILAHPDILSCPFNKFGDAPAHILASTSVGYKILEYEKVLISVNKDEVSCIEILAQNCERRILNHPLVDCVFNKFKTPRQIYFESIPNIHNKRISKMIKAIDETSNQPPNPNLIFKDEVSNRLEDNYIHRAITRSIKDGYKYYLLCSGECSSIYPSNLTWDNNEVSCPNCKEVLSISGLACLIENKEIKTNNKESNLFFKEEVSMAEALDSFMKEVNEFTEAHEKEVESKRRSC